VLHGGLDRVQAIYYDGQSTRPRPVTLRLLGRELWLTGEEIDRRSPLSELRISEPLGSAPRRIGFPGGGHCEVEDRETLARMLHAAGHRDGLTVRLQARWKWVLVAVMVTIATVAAGYRWGLPAASEWLAYRLPPGILADIGTHTLDFLDEHITQPSNLPPDRRKAIEVEFERMKQADAPLPAPRIVFRDGGMIGANAFALPDGTIVVTDQLVRLAKTDNEILGVLAHEVGHLARRHSLRMLIQNSIVGAVVGWYLGDFSNIAAGASAAVLQAKYSRGFESEADDYAIRTMKLNAISPAALARMLERLQASADKKHRSKGERPFNGYLDSHPATAERIRKIESAGRASS
jgi:Zn-dependent protease with chaperone function